MDVNEDTVHMVKHAKCPNMEMIRSLVWATNPEEQIVFKETICSYILCTIWKCVQWLTHNPHRRNGRA